MPFHILAAAAVVTLVASNVAVDISGAQVVAAQYGRVLGAAAQHCHDEFAAIGEHHRQ